MMQLLWKQGRQILRTMKSWWFSAIGNHYRWFLKTPVNSFISIEICLCHPCCMWPCFTFPVAFRVMSLHNTLLVSPDLLKNVAHIPLVSIKPFTEEITPGVFLCSELLGPNIRKRASSSLGIFGKQGTPSLKDAWHLSKMLISSLKVIFR